jgi:nitrate/nitrite transporter NarK
MTVQLTTVAQMDLVSAGRILALYQIAGSVSRPIWGWVADRFLTPSHTLAVHGAGMAAAAALTGQFGPAWPGWTVAAVILVAGCTAGGYTGVAYAEYAHLGGARRTEATGLGTALMFSGGMLMPTIFSAAITARGDYGLTYGAAALLALAGSLLLAVGTGRWRKNRNEN